MDIKNLLKTLGLAIIMMALFVLPDYLYAFVNKDYYIKWTFLVIKFLCPLSLGLVLCKNKWIAITTLVLLFALQIMQFSRLDYFGRLLTPSDFVAMIDEWHDVVHGAGDAFSSHWEILPVVLIPFALMWSLTKIKIKKTIFGDIFIGITLIAVVLGNWLYRGVPYPLEGRVTIDNSLKSFSLFIVDLFRNYETPKYLPYEIKNVGIKTDEPITIVYIMGESVNAKHMSLFGYARDTTPKLKELAKSSDLYYTEGIASAICTKASSKFMGNVIWEPNNPKLTTGCETSLCKLAKENGFKVYYFAGKRNKMLNSVCNMSSKYIDEVKTRNTDEEHVSKVLDDYIIENIDSHEFTGRNLILLHKWCIHVPYSKAHPESYTPKHQFTDGSSEMIDQYDTAMLYEDDIVTRIFNRFNKPKSGKVYIFYASDHNECMGEGGVYSHSFLYPQVADIPVIVQSNDKEFMKKFKSIFKPTHYEISMMIANLLGFEIKNPNEKENVFYINGLDYDGRGGYIELTKHPETKTVSYVTHYRKCKNEPRK